MIRHSTSPPGVHWCMTLRACTLRRFRCGPHSIWVASDFPRNRLHAVSATSPMPVGFLPFKNGRGCPARTMRKGVRDSPSFAPRVLPDRVGVHNTGTGYSWGHSTRRFPMITRRSISPRALATDRRASDRRCPRTGGRDTADTREQREQGREFRASHRCSRSFGHALRRRRTRCSSPFTGRFARARV